MQMAQVRRLVEIVRAVGVAALVGLAPVGCWSGKRELARFHRLRRRVARVARRASSRPGDVQKTNTVSCSVLTRGGACWGKAEILSSQRKGPPDVYSIATPRE